MIDSNNTTMVLSVTRILGAVKLVSRIELSPINDFITLESTKGHQGAREMRYLIESDSIEKQPDFKSSFSHSWNGVLSYPLTFEPATYEFFSS